MSGVLDSDGHKQLAGAEHASEVDVVFFKRCFGHERVTGDYGIESHASVGGSRVVGKYGEFVETRAGNHVCVGCKCSLDFHAFSRADKAVGGGQSSDERCFGGLEFHGGAAAEQTEAAVVRRGFFNLPVIGHVGRGEGDYISHFRVVDAAEQRTASLEYGRCIVVVVEDFYVAVAAQHDAEAHRDELRFIDAGKHVAEIHHELAVAAAVLHARLRTHLELASVSAYHASAGDGTRQGCQRFVEKFVGRRGGHHYRTE